MTDFEWVAAAIVIWICLICLGCALCSSPVTPEERRRIRREIDEWRGHR